MRSILVYADRGTSMPSRLETALSLARATGGHVTVLVDTPIQRYISMDPMGGSYVATDALNQALADDDAHAEAIAGKLEGQDVPFDVVHTEIEPVDALASASRLADVVVLSRSCGMAGDLATITRTPLLVLPDEAELALPLGSSAIAWDGGDEAALALRSCVPLLAGCENVHVVTVKDKTNGFPPIDALSYLSRHGIKAELHELTRNGSTEETLAGTAVRLKTDLLVMGAYGHSRMREYFFGGVTRYFLEDCPRPALLLAH